MQSALKAPKAVKTLETPKNPEAPVRVVSFGDGTFETKLSGRKLTVGDVFAEVGIDVKTRRASRNGHTTTLDQPVQPGDQLTLISRIFGG